MDTTGPLKHIVFYALIASWGHTKPITSLALRMVESRENVIVSLLVGDFYPLIMDELAKLPEGRRQRIGNRLHIVDVRGMLHSPSETEGRLIPEPTATKPIDPSLAFGFYPAFDALCRSETVTCNTSGKKIGGLPPPDIAIVDPFAGCEMEVIRSYAPSQALRVFACLPSPVNATLRVFCPPELGGRADVWKKAQQEIEESNGDPLEIGERLYTATTGEIVYIPGYPPAYDYEWFPQDQDEKYTAQFVMGACKFFSQADGSLSSTTSVLEGGATSAIKDYMRGLGKDFFSVGFAAGSIPSCPDPGRPKNEVESQVSAFLDKMHEQYGPGSLIYISFGSYWWPLETDKLYALIDELIANGAPFVFARPSVLAKVPEDVISRIAAVEYGLEVEWAPQDMILSHQATGWFVTHGGWNSVQESLRYGIPLVIWPLMGDQPMNAILVAQVHCAGFELMTVRTGEKGKMKPYSLQSDGTTLEFTLGAFRKEVKDLLVKLKSDVGWKIKENVRRIQKEIAGVWDDQEGEARKELEAFLVKYVD